MEVLAFVLFVLSFGMIAYGSYKMGEIEEENERLNKEI